MDAEAMMEMRVVVSVRPEAELAEAEVDAAMDEGEHGARRRRAPRDQSIATLVIIGGREVLDRDGEPTKRKLMRVSRAKFGDRTLGWRRGGEPDGDISGSEEAVASQAIRRVGVATARPGSI